jgi:hypothetical protein
MRIEPADKDMGDDRYYHMRRMAEIKQRRREQLRREEYEHMKNSGEKHDTIERYA